MAVNIEIKARLPDLDATRERVEKISDTPCQVIPQHDTFFNCPVGRLKLRELNPQNGHLVHYIRQDLAGPKHSAVQDAIADEVPYGSVVHLDRYVDTFC